MDELLAAFETDDAGWDSDNECRVRDVFRDNGVCPDNSIISNADSADDL